MTATPDPLAHARPQPWAAAVLRLFGWRTDLPPPSASKVLLIVYPHTSNWDFLWGILAKWAVGWPARWLGKHTLFLGPTGRLLRHWGGIAINRSEPSGFIKGLMREIDALDTLILAVTPEGTRGYVDHWKSGFMRIARAADMPVGLAYIDYKRRVVGVLEYMQLTGDEAADMAHIAAAYADVTARCPEKAGVIRLRTDSLGK